MTHENFTIELYRLKQKVVNRIEELLGDNSFDIENDLMFSAYEIYKVDKKFVYYSDRDEDTEKQNIFWISTDLLIEILEHIEKKL